MNVMPMQSPSVVLSAEHRAQLDAIARELEKPELSVDRRAALIAISDEIAAEYTCDPRLCE
jgi:hypothetical protein